MPKNNWKKVLEEAKFRVLVSDEANISKEIEEFPDSLDFRESIFQLIFYLGGKTKLSSSVAGNPIVQQQLPRNSKDLRELVIEGTDKSEEFIELGKDWKRVKEEIGKF